MDDPTPRPPEIPVSDVGASRRRPIQHSGITAGRYHAMHLPAALFPLMAGFAVFGWRAIGAVAAVVVAVVAATLVWRRVGATGGRMRLAPILWSGLLLAMALPAHLFRAGDPTDPGALWPILPAAGILLVLIIWILGGTTVSAANPVALTLLLTMALFGQSLVPRHVLRPTKLFTGDLLNAPTAPDAADRGPWVARRSPSRFDALHRESPAHRLTLYTSGTESPQRAWLSLDGLLRDALPPLEDLVTAGAPTPIGQASAVALLVGGLFLIYRGLIDYRIPLLACVVAFIALLMLPIPVVIRDVPEWRWAAWHVRGVGWATAITFANYELLAGPLLFTAFFLATAPGSRPMTRRGRTLFAVALGLATAAAQLYLSVSAGAYLALAACAMLTPILDRRLRPRPLV